MSIYSVWNLKYTIQWRDLPDSGQYRVSEQLLYYINLEVQTLIFLKTREFRGNLGGQSFSCVINWMKAKSRLWLAEVFFNLVLSIQLEMRGQNDLVLADV